MSNTQRTLLIAACLVAVSTLTPGPALAQTRTTPVEVTNTPLVGIDTNTNTVKAEQLGLWYMTLSGGSVAATQSGAWTVGLAGTPNVNVANTPSVSVSNSPTVKIDATANTVVAASKHNTIQPWTADLSIPSSTWACSPNIDCAGYDQVRALLWSSTLSSEITVSIAFRSPTGSFLAAKRVPFTGSSVIAIECPVYGDTCRIEISNSSPVGMTLYRHSYVYLVN